MITRRKVLKKLIYFSGFMLLKPDLLLSELGKKSESNQILSKLTNFFQKKESAKLVGNEYLKLVPEEAEIGLLVNLLCNKNKKVYSNIQRENSEKVKEILLRQHQKDLEKGRIVILSGWILSETEARLCALIAMT